MASLLVAFDLLVCVLHLSRPHFQAHSARHVQTDNGQEAIGVAMFIAQVWCN